MVRTVVSLLSSFLCVEQINEALVGEEFEWCSFDAGALLHHNLYYFTFPLYSNCAKQAKKIRKFFFWLELPINTTAILVDFLT